MGGMNLVQNSSHDVHFAPHSFALGFMTVNFVWRYFAGSFGGSVVTQLLSPRDSRTALASLSPGAGRRDYESLGGVVWSWLGLAAVAISCSATRCWSKA